MVWAEREGYAFDMITQTDLHYRPEILGRYKAAVIVGHDEYWTREMRNHVDAFVEAGGNLARFCRQFPLARGPRSEDEGRRHGLHSGAGAGRGSRPRHRQGRICSARPGENPDINWPGALRWA